MLGEERGLVAGDERSQAPEMLAVARSAAVAAGVTDRVDLRLGDLREPPVPERVPLVVCPFRSLLHMETEAEKLHADGKHAESVKKAEEAAKLGGIKFEMMKM